MPTACQPLCEVLGSSWKKAEKMCVLPVAGMASGVKKLMSGDEGTPGSGAAGGGGQRAARLGPGFLKGQRARSGRRERGVGEGEGMGMCGPGFAGLSSLTAATPATGEAGTPTSQVRKLWLREVK